MEEETGEMLDLEAMETKSAEDVVAEREEALAETARRNAEREKTRRSASI